MSPPLSLNWQSPSSEPLHELERKVRVGLHTWTLIESLAAFNSKAIGGGLHTVADGHRMAYSTTQLFKYREFCHSLFYVAIFILLCQNIKTNTLLLFKAEYFTPSLIDPSVKLLVLMLFSTVLLIYSKVHTGKCVPTAWETSKARVGISNQYFTYSIVFFFTLGCEKGCGFYQKL